VRDGDRRLRFVHADHRAAHLHQTNRSPSTALSLPLQTNSSLVGVAHLACARAVNSRTVCDTHMIEEARARSSPGSPGHCMAAGDVVHFAMRTVPGDQIGSILDKLPIGCVRPLLATERADETADE
jgi:hypothetical protein